MQAAGGVDDHDVERVLARALDAAANDRDVDTVIAVSTTALAADLTALGAAPEQAAVPRLPDIPTTDDALGRLYVLEGSTLGGTFIDRHLSGLPSLGDGVRVRAFSPYGGETGAMWHAYRQATREHVATGGDPRRVVAAARETFAALQDWCRPVGRADTDRPDDRLSA